MTLKPYSASVLLVAGFILSGMGLYFILVRPPLLPEDLHYMGISASKNNAGSTQFYFSKDASSPVQALTLANLKSAFPKNYPFHDRLDAQFGNGGDLSAYDAMHQMTKINWLLKESK